MLEPVFDEGSRSGPCAERPVADVGECAVVERAHQKVFTTYPRRDSIASRTISSCRANAGRMLQTGSGTSCRDAPYKDPQVISNLAFPKEWLDTMLESARIARPGLPVILPVTEFRDVIGVALTNMIGGADPATELKKATEQFKPILEKSEAT